jgi:hypothetical protein
MYIAEFVLLECLMFFWIYRTIKYNQPKKEHPYSYRVFVGNIGIAVIIIFTLIWFVANEKSFFTEFYNSIIK